MYSSNADVERNLAAFGTGLRAVRVASMVSLLLLCILPLASSLAASITWTGAVSSDWSNATNWTPQQVPTSTDTVIINSGTVQVASNAQFYALHLNGGTLGGSFMVRSNSVMNWNNGSLLADGSLTVESNGVLNIASGTTTYCDRSLTNHGAVNWTEGVFYLRNNNAGYKGRVVNLGLWEMQGDLVLEQYYNNGLEVFSNGGIFRKASGAGTGKFNAILDNQFGAIEVQSGTLRFERGGQLDGLFLAGLGAVVEFSGGTTTYTALTRLTGAGQYRLTGGTLEGLLDYLPKE